MTWYILPARAVNVKCTGSHPRGTSASRGPLNAVICAAYPDPDVSTVTRVSSAGA